MRSDAEDMRVALALSLKGQQLDRLDPDLPPSGPYVFRVQLLNIGNQYFLKDLKGQVGQSDVTGSLSLDIEEDIPQLSGAFSSAYLDMADLSTPSDATRNDAVPDDILIPVESLQALDADIRWEIKRIRAETVQLGDLVVDGNLKNGRLAFTTLKGKFFDRKQTYAEFQGELALDTTTDIRLYPERHRFKNWTMVTCSNALGTTVSWLVSQTWTRIFPVRAIPSLPC